MSKVIEIVVSPQGETTIKTQGYAGAECQRATKSLKDALGARASEVKTAEFYSTSGTTAAQQQGGNS